MATMLFWNYLEEDISVGVVAVHIPIEKGRRKQAVIGPDATPPESKAMDVKISGTKNVSTKAIAYPIMRGYIIEMPVSALKIAIPTEIATPTSRAMPRAFLGIAPDVTSSTCFLST